MLARDLLRGKKGGKREREREEAEGSGGAAFFWPGAGRESTILGLPNVFIVRKVLL